ncbi:MAG: NAD(P)-dependent glycerol-3-phosphate dehydrogenase [Rhodospirillales bacterium]|nr:NAD(P)-dependent glycerol-3-phosphate dehydrogenase [Rhodospirillales bacterium]
MIERIGILGAGAWGTALAIAARRSGRAVILQARDPSTAAAIARQKENARYLPGVRLDDGIRLVSAPRDAIAGADAVLLAVPAQALRAVLQRCACDWPPGLPAVICAKGIEEQTCALMSEVIADVIPAAPVCVLSGPSFAAEAAREQPTAVTFACADPGLRQTLPVALGSRSFRIYSSDDVVGAELGGAVKNVLAIACGIVAGKSLGDNARAALITRGVAELARFAASMGARPETVFGLSGLGDLVLTCSAFQSRNFSLGVALGRGKPLNEILESRNTVVEGVYTAASVTEIARRDGVDMPICAAVDAVLNRGADLERTIADLLARPLRAEVFAA